MSARFKRLTAYCKRLAALFLLPCALVSPALAGDAGAFTPSQSAACGHKACYWTTPMDITDEAAVWEMLMAPVTVVAGHQKAQSYLLESPDESAAIAGEVTNASQSIHVLAQTEDGWTLAQTYCSAFKGSKTEKWNELVTGYIRTDALTQITPDPGMGLVVDKLTQRLYIFKEGKLFETLRISTGLANEKQPFNETRSGEFFLVSKVGGFTDGSMTCEKALRFNDGDLLHLVPYDNRSGKNYEVYERLLGQRASHGCIRTQRKRTPLGVNMTWVWDNYKLNTKLVIWEDWPGREKPVSPLDTVVYYNPDGGKTYHRGDFCYGVKEKYLPLVPLTLGEAISAARAFTPCVWCNPPEAQ